MQDINKMLNGALKSLLNEQLSEQEVQSLKDEGFDLKIRKRSAAIMIALYKKAAAGDLSAIKELRSIAGEQPKDIGVGKAVILIDDIGNKDVGDSRRRI